MTKNIPIYCYHVTNDSGTFKRYTFDPSQAKSLTVPDMDAIDGINVGRVFITEERGPANHIADFECPQGSEIGETMDGEPRVWLPDGQNYNAHEALDIVTSATSSEAGG